MMPWPLQEFNPLQALVAVLQLPLPLQLLTPAQCIMGAVVAVVVVEVVVCVSANAAEVNNAATAVAMTMPVCFVIISTSPCKSKLSE